MYIDKELALRYLGGLEALYNKVCQSFITNYADFPDRIKKTNNPQELFVLVHNLKAISLNIGASKLYDLIKDNRIDDMEVFLDTFQNTYQELLHN